MNNISFYLKKYSTVGLKSDQIKKSITEAIKEVCGIDVDKKNIKINDKTLNINIQGVEKSEIFINTNSIQKVFLDKLNNLGFNIDKKKIF